MSGQKEPGGILLGLSYLAYVAVLICIVVFIGFPIYRAIYKPAVHTMDKTLEFIDKGLTPNR